MMDCMYLRITRELNLETGLYTFEEFRLNNRLHRPEKAGPAKIEYATDGSIYTEMYYWHGRMHRSDGPALISPSNNPKFPRLTMYWRHGKLHRDPKEGPAVIECEGEVITLECYYVNGNLYRDPADGPCRLARHVDGTPDYEEYSSERPKRTYRRRPAGTDPAP